MNDDRRAASARTLAPTRELAAWISGLKYEDIPQRTREVVRIAILDTLGCGVYGYSTPWADMMLRWARTGGAGKGDATVWGEKAAIAARRRCRAGQRRPPHMPSNSTITTTPSCTPARWPCPRRWRWPKNSVPTAGRWSPRSPPATKP